MIKKRFCCKCGHKVQRGKLVTKGYKYYCPFCDEDLYKFETVGSKGNMVVMNWKDLT
jgi:hypothetical protein